MTAASLSCHTTRVFGSAALPPDPPHAAMLAPTAMNQQKFRFELLPDGTVKAACGSGFYTKLDLGIVKYHFEAVTGKKTV